MTLDTSHGEIPQFSSIGEQLRIPHSVRNDRKIYGKYQLGIGGVQNAIRENGVPGGKGTQPGVAVLLKNLKPKLTHYQFTDQNAREPGHMI